MKAIDKIKMEIDLNRREVGRQRGIYLAQVDMEMQMLDKFERWMQNIEEDFNKLMESYEYLDDEIEKLAEFIINNIEGEPSEDESAIELAIRLLSKGVQ